MTPQGALIICGLLAFASSSTINVQTTSTLGMGGVVVLNATADGAAELPPVQSTCVKDVALQSHQVVEYDPCLEPYYDDLGVARPRPMIHCGNVIVPLYRNNHGNTQTPKPKMRGTVPIAAVVGTGIGVAFILVVLS